MARKTHKPMPNMASCAIEDQPKAPPSTMPASPGTVNPRIASPYAVIPCRNVLTIPATLRPDAALSRSPCRAFAPGSTYQAGGH
jgi:hypothetical protein